MKEDIENKIEFQTFDYETKDLHSEMINVNEDKTEEIIVERFLKLTHKFGQPALLSEEIEAKALGLTTTCLSVSSKQPYCEVTVRRIW